MDGAPTIGHSACPHDCPSTCTAAQKEDSCLHSLRLQSDCGLRNLVRMHYLNQCRQPFFFIEKTKFKELFMFLGPFILFLAVICFFLVFS